MTVNAPEPRHGIIHQFRRNRLALFGFATVCVLLAIGAFADFIANDKPLLMHYGETTFSPVLRDYAVSLGLSQWQPELQNISFKELAARDFKSGDWAWFPPIRYSPNDVDLNDVAGREPLLFGGVGADQDRVVPTEIGDRLRGLL